MNETYWLAICKNGTAALGKITLGEFSEGSKYLRVIVGRETILGDFGTMYELGQRAAVEGNNAIYKDRLDALIFLTQELEDSITSTEKEAADVAAKYVAKISNMHIWKRMILRMCNQEKD